MSRLRDHDLDVSDVVLFEPLPTRQRWAAADLLRLLIGLVLVGAAFGIASFAEETIAGIEDDVVSGIGRMPDRVEAAVLGTAPIIATFVPLV
ncbi:MAG TPA: hypothetical protein VK860_02010, partial [Ilumatobacteraceae bacterium]|nr:hypothetical protein [Ilumatobacteraceae bacterium]